MKNRLSILFCLFLYCSGMAQSLNEKDLWTNVYGTQRALSRPVFCNAFEGYAISSGHVVCTKNAGATWEPTAMFNPHENNAASGFTDLLNPVPGLVFVIRDNILYRSANNGNTWLPVLHSANAVSMVNSFVGYAVTSISSEVKTILQTLDGGNVWQPVSSLNIHGNDARIIIACRGDANHLFVLGPDGAAYTSENGGATWANAGSPGTPYFQVLYGLSFFNNNRGVASGYNTITGVSFTSYTTDGGLSWLPSSFTGCTGGYQLLLDKTENKAFLVGSGTGCNGKMLRSDDFGESWTNTGIGPHNGSGQVVAINSQNLFKTNPYQKSTDGGTTWNPLLAANELTSNHYPYQFFPFSETNYLMALLDVENGQPAKYRTLKSTTAGASWTEIENVKALYDFKGLAGVRMTNSGFAYTTDGGENWITLSTSGFGPLFAGGGIKMISSTSFLLFVAYSSSNDAVVKTIQISGNSAEVVNEYTYTGTAPFYSNTSFLDEQHGAFATSDGQMWTTSDGGLSWAAATLPTGSYHFGKLVYKSENQLCFINASSPNVATGTLTLFSAFNTESPTVHNLLNGYTIGSFDMQGNSGIAVGSAGSDADPSSTVYLTTSNNWAQFASLTYAPSNNFVEFGAVRCVWHESTLWFYVQNELSNVFKMEAGTSILSAYIDRDEDTYFGSFKAYFMSGGVSIPISSSFNDCNDDDPSVHPGAADNTCNQQDDDCDGLVDEDVPLDELVTYYPDSDGDGKGDANSAGVSSCNPLAGMVTNNHDCDDSRATIWFVKWYADEDLDGFGNPSSFQIACTDPSDASHLYVRNNNDCNDSDPGINPSVSEIPGDGIDNDCDGSIDEETDPEGTTYCDMDGDGFGDPGCPIPPSGLTVHKGGQAIFLTAGVPNNTDCDDGDPGKNPRAFEVADGLDNDCDQQTDDGTEVPQWFFDADGDGYGRPDSTLIGFEAPPNYVSLSGDCNDHNAAIHPGAIELCGNGLDDNCDGATDENNPVADSPGNQLFCSGQLTTGFMLSGSPGAEFSWTNSNPSIGLTASGNGPVFPSFQAVNNTTNNLVATIQLIAETHLGEQTCLSHPVSFTITIQAKPVVSAGPDQSVSISLENLQLNATPAGGTWSGVGVTSSGLFNTNQVAGSYPLVYSVLVNGCAGADTVMVVLNPASGGKVAAPIFTPPAGPYPVTMNVSLSCVTEGAEIYYTTNGNLPRLDIPNYFTKLYTGSFQILSSTKVYAVAVKAGMTNSSIVSGMFTLESPGICATPAISPITGSYSGAQTITISTTTPGAQIYYTTSGNIPVVGTSFTKLYSTPFVINASATVRAIAIKTGIENSGVAVAFITLTASSPVAETPIITPGTGNFAAPQTVSISCATAGSTLYYTTNGNVPRLDVPNYFTKIYTGPFVINQSATIRSIATAPGYITSGTGVAFISLVGSRRAVFASNEELSVDDEREPCIIPNPSQGRFTLRIPGAENEAKAYFWHIYSTDGKKVADGSAYTSVESFDLSDQPIGMYTMVIQSEKGINLLRIIKQ